MKNLGKEDVFLTVILVVLLFATIFVYIKNGNIWSVQVMSACLGAIITIIATRLLLSKQSDLESKREIDRRKADEKEKRDFEIYNAKLDIYSDFVSNMYDIISDNNITEEKFLNLRTKLLGKVCFYVNNKEVLEGIKTELDKVKDYTDNNRMANAFAAITNILQKDLRKDDVSDTTTADISSLWGKFEEISANTNNENEVTNAMPISNETVQRQEQMNEESERLEQQAWHFIMWDDKQLDKLKEGFTELSLVEWEETWRTNLVKQVAKGDYIMLFRRGGYGYIGAYKAIGWRVFYFEEEREEIQMFGDDDIKEIKKETNGKQYKEDIEKFDIYNSGEDGYTTCANIIVEPIAFVETGVGNPGGVYRRTISRYDPHYAWQLKQLFIKEKAWDEK